MNLEQTVLQVHIEDIIPNRFQPRLNFDEQGLQELAASIREHGIIQPLVLRKLGDKYEIIAGERRYKAAQIAGLTTVPAVIANIDDNQSAEVALVENVQRRDLTAIEEARSYKNLLDKGYLTQDQLAKRMGLSQPAVANKLRLLNLDEEVQQALLEEKISERHARTLLSLPLEEQREWLHRIINERLTVRQLDIEIKKAKGIPEEDDDNQDGGVPLVTKIPSIEDIKANAVDIKDLKNGTQTEELETNDLLDEQPVNDFNESPSNDFEENSYNSIDEPLKKEEEFTNTSNLDFNKGEFKTTSDNFDFNITTPHSTDNLISEEKIEMPSNNNNRFFGAIPESTPTEPVFASLDNTSGYAPNREDNINFNTNKNDNSNFNANMNNNFNSFTGAATNDFEEFNSSNGTVNSNPYETNSNPFMDASVYENKQSVPAPEFNKPREIIKPEFNSQINPTAQMEINPNNKFFTPISQKTSDQATIVRPTVTNTDVDPMAAVDRLSKSSNSEASPTGEPKDLKYAIDSTRQAIDKLGSEGFYIDVEEIDFPEVYQITMRIHKGN